MNFQMFKLVLEKAEEPDQIANICRIKEKAREFQKNIYFCFIDYAKAFEFVCYANAKSLQSCPTLCDPIDGSPPGSTVPGILQARYWSGLPFPSPGDLPDPEIEPGSPALQADTLPSDPLGSQV